MGIPDHLTCSWEICVQVKKQQNWSWNRLVPNQEGSTSCCILSPYLTYRQYIMRNAWLEEAQAGITFAGKNINNLRYADDTTLMAERTKELLDTCSSPGAIGITGTHSRLTLWVRPRLEGKQRILISSWVAIGISWSPLSDLQGVKPPVELERNLKGTKGNYLDEHTIKITVS